MKKSLFLVFILVVLGLPTIMAQEAEGPANIGLRPDAPEYALHGPYWVGTIEEITESDSAMSLPLTIWYPATNSSGLAEEIVYPTGIMGHAIANAEPDVAGGPYPLLIFSHGLGTDRHFSVFLTEHLASYGFVVIALDHPSTSFGFWMDDEDAIPGKVMSSFVDRPLEVSKVIDFASMLNEGNGILAGLVDMELIGVAGHSMGGHSVYTAVGARIGFNNVAIDGCRTGENPDSACWVSESEQLLADVRDGAPVPGEMWPDFSDDRIDAVVALAPWTLTISDESYSNIAMPVLTIVGSADLEALPDFNGGHAYELLGSEHKALVTFENAFHGIYNEICDVIPEERQPPIYALCADEVWDMARSHDLINHFVTAFMLTELYGDEAASAALTPDAVQFPGIIYATTGF